MRQIGIMGGTFDPIHIGHLFAAECAREDASLDEVWFMPTRVPPHKPKQPTASPEQRLEMVKLAVHANPHFHASDWELVRSGKSYTYDTVTELQTAYPDVQFSWIIGGDMVAYLPKWHRIDELMQRIRFVGLHRPGTEWDTSTWPITWQERLTIARMPQMDISSTAIRERLANDQSIRYIVPDTVVQYMARWGLYEAKSRTID
ncbi:nicotinate-nucleotide adenylyltransferase [Paenibacillus sp. 481]|uniref:nicotinate-nucleotide adenylyltransferase n=1 Tax=Paenibacillus sp. 481 TaxID=2835869 RepID=UPI001E40283F|nr:nicotinate-nucleotide adenylyltransferase [Paenibacillus sp. 481]UHA74227.1 nicotinate-nucleotide adenylyltransferase [Paenibacillus sp. 481]